MKKFLVAVSATVTAVLLSGCALLYPNWGTDQNPSSSMSPSASPESPSASPSVSPSASRRAASVQLVNAEIDTEMNLLFVTAEVSNFSEIGGTCTLTFTSGSKSLTANAKAEPNVNRTECFPLQISLSSLPKGNAKLVVTYQSEDSFGTSSSTNVVIP